jgi:hypothetical protein
MLEARHFVIFTDHKPITYAFQQKKDKCSPWQFNHLDFIAQFQTFLRSTGNDEFQKLPDYWNVPVMPSGSLCQYITG